VLRRWFHPGPLIVLLMSTALALVLLARSTPHTNSPASSQAQEAAPVAQLRALRFVDQADGAVVAVDNHSGKQVQRFEGEQGFLRGTLRAMVRERRMRGLGAELPFELMLHHDGRLTLHDPSTGTRIALESFGATNTRVFAGLLR
jgi:putative photosynthetic complex assembly protein